MGGQHFFLFVLQSDKVCIQVLRFWSAHTSEGAVVWWSRRRVNREETYWIWTRCWQRGGEVGVYPILELFVMSMHDNALLYQNTTGSRFGLALKYIYMKEKSQEQSHNVNLNQWKEQ